MNAGGGASRCTGTAATRPTAPLFRVRSLTPPVYSLNVPVPPAVSRLAGEVARDLPAARERSRGRHTLVVKRLGTGDRETYHAIEARAREALRGQPPFAAGVTGLDLFEEATTGTSPVVYLTVESPGLYSLHRDLCTHFDPVDDVEGDDYTPHVTVARGGSREDAERACERSIDPIEWTVDALTFLDAERGNEAGRVSLPA